MKKTGEYNKIAALALIATLTLGTLSAGCSGGNSGGSSSGGGETSATAVEMRLQRAVGNVKLTNEKGEEQSLMEKMRLAAGNALLTGKDSLANVSLDETKLVTIEESSKVQINGSSQNLEINCTEGGIFFNVTEKVPEGSTVDIRVGNTVCGIRGTSGYEGRDEDGNDMVMAADGQFEVTAIGPDGSETKGTASPGEKIVVKKENNAAGGQAISLQKSTFKEEELPPVALVTISKDRELMDKVTGSASFSADRIRSLAESMTREVPGGTSGETIPIMGHEARLLSKAASEAREIAGDDLKLQSAIINGVKTTLEQARENGASDDELTKTAETVTDTIKNKVTELQNSGVSGEEIIKVVEEVTVTNGVATIPNAAGQTTGTQNPPQNVTEGNVQVEATGETGYVPDYDYDSGSGRKKKKEETPVTPEVPETPAAPEPSQVEPGNEQQQQPLKTTGEAREISDGTYEVTLSNGSTGHLVPDSSDAGYTVHISTYGGKPIVMPIELKMLSDGREIKINSIWSLGLDEALSDVEVQNVSDNAGTMAELANIWGNAISTVTGPAGTVTRDDDGLSVEVTMGTVTQLKSFINACGVGDVYKATYGGIEHRRNLDLGELNLVGSGYSVSGAIRESESTDEYLLMVGTGGQTGGPQAEGRWRLYPNGTITEDN